MTVATTRWPRVIAALLFCLGNAHAEVTGPEAATAVVRDLHETLLESMKAGAALDFEQRKQRLRPMIERTHHFDVITGFMLGRHAAGLDEEQFEQVVAALERLSLAEYATHFDDYNGETLRILEASPIGDQRAMVAAELTRANGDSVSLDYMLQFHEGRWGVVNVIADGVSDLALRRAEYSRVLREEGYAALLERLRRQAGEVEPG